MNSRASILLTICLCVAVLLFLAGARLLFTDAPPLIAAQDDSVGEMLLDEGLRLEENRYRAAALEKYRLAEHARFQGTKNLRHLHYLLAQHATEPGQKEHYLRLAISDDALTDKAPALWRRAWTQLAQLLADAHRVEDLRTLLDTWDSRVNATNVAYLYPSSDDAIKDREAREAFRAVVGQSMTKP